MVLNIILVLVAVTTVASVINLFDRNNKSTSTIPMKIQLPSNLPIISLSNNKGDVFNFLIDSGSNISHICAEYFDSIDAAMIGVYEDGSVEGLGSVNKGITMCSATFNDTLGNKYIIDLSVSDQLSAVANSIEMGTGVKIHGLLGTDFLRKYKYVIDFKSFEVYPKK